jgi:hypothetical protein
VISRSLQSSDQRGGEFPRPMPFHRLWRKAQGDPPLEVSKWLQLFGTIKEVKPICCRRTNRFDQLNTKKPSSTDNTFVFDGYGAAKRQFTSYTLKAG